MPILHCKLAHCENSDNDLHSYISYQNDCYKAWVSKSRYGDMVNLDIFNYDVLSTSLLLCFGFHPCSNVIGICSHNLPLEVEFSYMLVLPNCPTEYHCLCVGRLDSYNCIYQTVNALFHSWFISIQIFCWEMVYKWFAPEWEEN